uniref:V-type proton ATPase subunit C n=1 Tax=Lygus hesperus TaxID=30085 RepID=A0A0A9Y5H8_LYGHE
MKLEEMAQQAGKTLSTTDNGVQHSDAANGGADTETKVERKSARISTPTVVPDSAVLVIDENQVPGDEYVLYRVVLFKRHDHTTNEGADNVDAWKALCREQRWTVRPFEYNKDEEKQNSILLADLTNKRRAAWRYLLMWTETKFDGVFISWIHIIAAKVFVESILRYGVRAVFSAV